MDSYISYDKTLPIDMNGSTNPDLLTEVTYGEIGASPMVEKSSTGRMSPVRGRTMKEYDVQISELKKENFNLKLRIFFLEERLNTKFSGEDTIKTNIELKVEVESYKQDLLEKQQMLEKASETIDSMTAKYSEELEKEVMKISQEFNDKLGHSNQRVSELEENLKDLEKQLQEREEELAGTKEQLTEQKQTLEALNQDVEDRDGEIADLNGQLQSCKHEVESVRAEAERDRQLHAEELERLTTNETRKERDIQRLSILVKDRTSIEGVTALERAHLQDQVEDARRQVDKLQRNCRDQEREIARRSDMIGKMEDLLREKEHEKDDLSKALDDKSEKYRRCKEQLAVFIKAMHDKKNEFDKLMEKNATLQETIRRLQTEIDQLRQELDEAKHALELARQDKHREADKMGHLEQELEGLARSLGKKEGELEKFRELLETAERSLCESEEVVKSLERELAKVQHGGKSEETVGRLMQQIDDLQDQLQARDQAYKDKCGELDTIARSLNIHVTAGNTPTPTSSPGGKSEELQRILDELRTLKEAVQSDRHLHINISSSHLNQDGGSVKLDGACSSPSQDSLNNTYPGYGQQHSQLYSNQQYPGDQHQNGQPFGHGHQLTQQTQTLHNPGHMHQNGLTQTQQYPGHGHQNGHSTHAISNGSRIPVRKGSGSGSTSGKEDQDLERQLMEMRARYQDLETTLKATEETVHCQTQKMKFYRGMLVEHDLLPASMSRSSSVPNLVDVPGSPRRSPVPRERLGSLDNSKRPSRSRSVDRFSPPTMTTMDPLTLDKLSKENAQLKQQVDGYKKVLKAFQDRSPSPVEKGEREMMNAEGACRQLEGWLDMLDRFLLEVSHAGDQGGCGASPTVSSTTTDVSILRRGLIQARGAIQTLSETSLADNSGHDKSGEGRLSPDSGCSDNNTASAPATLKSPLVSPARSHTSSTSSQDKSPTSPSRHRTNQRTKADSPLCKSTSITGSHLDGSPSKAGPHTMNDSATMTGSKMNRSPGFANMSDSKLNLSPNKYSDMLDGGQSYPSKNRSFDTGETEFAQLPDRKIGNQPGDQTSHSDYSYFSGHPNMHSIESIEKLRHFSANTNKGDISVYSLPDNDSFITHEQEFDLKSGDSVYSKTKGVSFMHSSSPDTRSQNKQSSYKTRESLYKKTLTQTLLGNMLEDESISEGPEFSRVDFSEMIDMTHDLSNEDRVDKAELQERIRSLEEIIKSYQEQIAEKRRPDMTSLQEQLMELRQLRIQLEKSLRNNENLEKLLNDLARSSEFTIHGLKKQISDLHNQLSKCQHTIREKVEIITEKERLINETKSTLGKVREASANDNKDLQLQKEKVRILQEELEEKTLQCENVTGLCQPLKNAVEQLKKRCEQLEVDNKRHVESVNKYQHSVKDLENQLHVKDMNLEKLEPEIDHYRTRITELESDSNLYKENETKYKTMLAQNRSQITKLVAELEQVKEEYKQMESVKEELEGTRDTIEEQDRQLFEKSLRIEQLTQDWNEKCELIRQGKDEREKLTGELEAGKERTVKLSSQLEQTRMNCANYKRQVEKQNHTVKDLRDKIDRLNEELAQNRESNQLEQTRMNCANYKRQVEKQNHMVKDLRDKIDRLNKELTQNTESKESVEKLFMDKQKEMQEVTRTRDKYLYNLKLMHKEFTKCKKEAQELEKKYQNTSALNSSLTVELNVREKLMEERGDMLTDDAKQNIIAELLNELKCARIQMTTILEQNDKIKQKMSQLLHENDAVKRSGNTSSGIDRQSSTSVEFQSRMSADFSETHGSPSPANTTWPFSDNPKSDKGANSSRNSLPPREGTLEGASKEKNYTSGDRHKGIKSEFRDPFSSPSVGSSTSSGGPYFSVPGPIYKQGISDQCLLYNVNDSPKHVAGLTQFRIDSDVRSLFAIGMIDHFEKLRKETGQCSVLLKGLTSRINERLKAFAVMPASESVEYSTLKELSFSTEHLRICVDSQQAMIACFWTSELPAPNERGEFVNTKMVNEISSLQEQLCDVMAENEMLQKTSAQREKAKKDNSLEEEEFCRSLASTLDIVSRAKTNLQGSSPPRDSHQRKRPGSPRK